MVESNQEKLNNWISEFEFCNHTKINTVALILCRKGFHFLRLANPRFAIAYTSKPFRYRYFAAYPFGFKVFNRISTRWYFQLVEKKKDFAWGNAKEVVESLGNGSFVAVTNLAPHSWLRGSLSQKCFSNKLQGLTSRWPKSENFIVSRSIG